MIHQTLKAMAAAAIFGAVALGLAFPAEAGHGDAWGAGLFGLGVGAIIGSAVAPREVYVVPPPPPPAYYGPVSYAPPPWTPDWYAYCQSRYRGFDPRTGYVRGYGGYSYFCQ